MLLSSLVNKNQNNSYNYAKMMSGMTPVFSQFGRDIYASDIVTGAIERIATEISKLQPRHISTDDKGIQTTPKSSINRLFKFAPNQLMTTHDFLEKIMWLLYRNYNCFIYPTYEQITDSRGNSARRYTGFFPLNPTTVTFLQDGLDRLFVKMDFSGGSSLTILYSDIIHLRKRFSANDIMGGDINGWPDHTALLKMLETDNTVIQGLGKAIKTSLSVRGIIKIATVMDDEKQQAERKQFEKALNDSGSGILPLDLKGDYIDLKPDPKIIEKDTIEFIRDRILSNIGVPYSIWSGDFNDEQYQAWYETSLEHVVISLGQAFSVCLFSQNQLDFGNEIVFYQRDMMYLSTANKLKLLEVTGAQGLLTDDQKLKILGYPPLLDGTGSRRTISLNFVSVDIADQYQLKKAGTLGSVLNTEKGSGDGE